MDHLIDALPSDLAVVCVGEERITTRSVMWCRESPAGGGPVAGIEHLEHLEQFDAGIHDTGVKDAENRDGAICVVVGGDMPFAAAAVSTLVDALNAQPGLDAALTADRTGARSRCSRHTSVRSCRLRSRAIRTEPGSWPSSTPW